MTRLNILCGSLRGTLHVRLDDEDDGPRKAYVSDGAGNEYTPTAFETYSGYKCKKWKWSFFVVGDEDAGCPPRRFCDWLAERKKL